jgi:hypothetical protein
VKVWINGVLEIDVSGADTLNGSGSIEVIQMRGNGTGSFGVSGQCIVVRDIYIRSGEDNLGPCQTVWRAVDGNSSPTDWTGAGGGIPDGAGGTITSNTPTDQSRFTLAALGVTGDIIQVTAGAIVRRVTPGTGQAILTLYSGGTPQGSPDTLNPPNTSYGAIHGTGQEVDPDTSSAWDAAGFNAAEIEIEYV